MSLVTSCVPYMVIKIQCDSIRVWCISIETETQRECFIGVKDYSAMFHSRFFILECLELIVTGFRFVKRALQDVNNVFN